MIYKSLFIFYAVSMFLNRGNAQNIGIGTNTINRSKLEVWGVVGNTSGIFGTDQGISVQRDPAAIGFNQYNGKYMANGNAAAMSFSYGANSGLNFTFYPSGIINNNLGTAITALRLGTSTMNKILSSNSDLQLMLDVGRGTGVNGTAYFVGTNWGSHFNWSTNEDTYIRGGKPASSVYINDVGQEVRIGGGNTIVGINYNNPVYTFEVRQVGGTGYKMGNTDAESWEWRVAGSPANFYARFASSIRTYFSPVDGTLHPISDERLKTDIEEMQPVLSRIMKLRPVTYAMKDNNPNNTRSIGFIAQEVDELFPEIVSKSSIDSVMWSMQYSSLSVIATKAIQEEQKIIEQVERNTNTIEELLNKIEKIVIKQKNEKH